MRFSVWPDAGQPWSDLLRLVQRSEQQGWDGAWVADHFMPNGAAPLDGPVHEVWSVLAALAASTTRIRLGPLVCSVTYRHPAVLAATASTCDQISGGRMVLGIGAGWQVNEHDAYGLELGSVRARCDRLEEAAEAIRSLLDERRTDLDGQHFRFDDAPNDPKPPPGRLPLMVAGRGERRTLRTAARYADEWNAWTTASELQHKRDVLAAHCEEAGRDISDIGCSTQAFVCFDADRLADRSFRSRVGDRLVLSGSADAMLDGVAELAAAGADELIIADWPYTDPAERDEVFDRFHAEVASVFHD